MKITVQAIGFVLIFIASQVAHAITFSEAMGFYSRNDFDRAKDAFLELAVLGNDRAIFNLGVMNVRGEAFEKNYVQGHAWLKLSALYGNETADSIANKVAARLNKGQIARAEEVFAELLKTHGPSAVHKNLLSSDTAGPSLTYSKPRALRKRTPKYPRTEQKRGRVGIVDIQYSIGIDGTVRNPIVINGSSKAFENVALKAIKAFLYEPARVGDVPTEEYGRRLRFIFQLTGAEINKDYVEDLVGKAKAAAYDGTGKDKYIYAVTLAMIRSVGSSMKGYSELELEREGKWYQKSAQDGFSVAKYELGRRLSYGQQCAIDLDKSYFWLESAAEEKVPDAQLLLGIEVYHGARYERNVDQGIALLREAADSNFVPAKIQYAWVLATSANDAIYNPKLAKRYLEGIEAKTLTEKIGYFDTMAVVQYSMGDFKQAKSAIKKAYKERKESDLPGGTTEQIETLMMSGKSFRI
ncbi:TonB family protein [Teredinibacter franksiae]|uniref:TonB family protein n=1 Tax=Teredinibacter franksiae TaxID=2761453 RepID=UPI0016287B40|nr:TonB family protein [Teredinibacter franksiae]